MVDHVNFYENLEEAQFRLSNTVVTYDDEPVWIQDVANHRDGILRLFMIPLPNRVVRRYADDFVDVEEDAPPNGAAIRKKINSPRFKKFRPFEMGFCNFFQDYPKAKYLTRIPVRRSKQGLSSECFKVTHLNQSGADREGVLSGYLPLPEFRDCIVGIYPSFGECMDTLRPDTAIGIDREFAIERDELGLDFLYHRTDKVGLVRTREVLLADKYHFLREKIMDCPNLPNNVGNL